MKSIVCSGFLHLVFHNYHEEGTIVGKKKKQPRTKNPEKPSDPNPTLKKKIKKKINHFSLLFLTTTN